MRPLYDPQRRARRYGVQNGRLIRYVDDARRAWRDLGELEATALAARLNAELDLQEQGDKIKRGRARAKRLRGE